MIYFISKILNNGRSKLMIPQRCFDFEWLIQVNYAPLDFKQHNKAANVNISRILYYVLP